MSMPRDSAQVLLLDVAPLIGHSVLSIVIEYGQRQ